MDNQSPVSIIIPCRNEEQFIAKCLDSVIANNYPKNKIEILVIDGMSEDGTREIIKRYVQTYPFIRPLDNQKQIAPVAQNIGINNAKHEIIMIMDAHAAYEKDYIIKLVNILNEYDTDNVGGKLTIVPRENTLIAKAIVTALSHPFGVGNSSYRIESSKQASLIDADTVPFGCFKKEIFKKIGPFDENLARSYDLDFNVRLKRAGGKILLNPKAKIFYFARSNYISFCKHNFWNGIWVLFPLKFGKAAFFKRHLIPFFFVLSLIVFQIFSFLHQVSLMLFIIISGTYLLTNIYFSCNIAFKKRDIRYFFMMSVIFASLHISYGLGSLWGGIKLLLPTKSEIHLRNC